MELFVSMKVELSTGTSLYHFCVTLNRQIVSAGEHGVIDGAFGTSGKFRVTIPGLLTEIRTRSSLLPPTS